MSDSRAWIVLSIGSGYLAVAIHELFRGEILERAPGEMAISRSRTPIKFWLLLAAHAFIGALFVFLSLTII